MIRIFDEHIKRNVRSLDGAWKFKVDGGNAGVSEGWFSGLSGAETVTVPSVWTEKLGLLEYEGACWYEKDFYTEGGTVRFVFGAVMTDCRVWLDGKEIGSHYGGFCAFELIENSVAEGYHRLTLRVDNSFDEKSIPQRVVDWYHCGGITRPITIERLSGICPLSNRLEYTLSEDLKTLTARFAIELYNAENKAVCDTLTASVAGVETEEKIELNPYECKEVFTKSFKIDNFELWSPKSPKLYDIKISTSTDDLFDRCGFRKVEIKKTDIFLNGEKIRLLGVNRHEDYPGFGFAFPKSLMQRDLDIAFDLGCNTLRGSHYPNDPYFVDMLDEQGILFWSEIPIWGGGFSESCLADPDVINRGADMHREMVKHYYNHPSIIIWGMHNEILTETKAGYEMSRIYYNLLKEIGGNRIVTYATNKALTDISYEFCDVVSINQYNGWYGEDIDSWAGFIEKVHARLDSLGFGDKPIIMSEFGGAAVYGHRNFETFKWSEDYQAKLLSHCLNLFLDDPKIAGTYIWQMCDMRTSPDAGLTRARGYNNKGILNEYRCPKNSYFAVRDIYNGKKR